MKTSTNRLSRRIAVTLLLGALWLTGCVVTSIYPYYTAKDVTFDPGLLGVWVDPEKPDAPASWTFAPGGTNAYWLTLRDGDQTNEFDAHLFQLAGERFLDLLGRERADYAAPTHLLLRVRQTGSQSELEFLNYEWLAKLLEQNPKALRHHVVPNPMSVGAPADGGWVVLTADTAALQKFIRKHHRNTNAWAEPMRLRPR